MKGVIVQVGEPKSIVLFNNGKIGAIPTPADCHTGMVVTVKFNNKLKIIFLASFLFLALLCAALAAQFTTVGYLQIIYGQQEQKNVSLELSYNRFERVISARPLNIFSVAPLTDMRVKGKSLNAAYQTITETLSSSETLRSQNRITVRIAQDNLEKMKTVEQGFELLNREMNVQFERYTLELYQTRDEL